ncbi:MAG TPA: DUF1848 family protein [Chloroflexota bacterium]|nr:DUF1848 family protein [Chloroflexota bacterium]
MTSPDLPRASGNGPQPLLAPGLPPDSSAIDCPHARAGRLPAPRPRVISASKRTDLPAFHLRWFLERCAAGWVDVPNPMFRYAADPLKRLTHVSLKPEHVLAIVWWSKNYAVYERFHERFAIYPTQYFHFTINPRRADLTWLEPDVPPLDEAIRQVRFLASLPGGPDFISWRYDPLCFWTESGEEKSTWDEEFFNTTCRELARVGVSRCITSLADHYAKFQQRMKRLYPEKQLRDPAAAELAAITRAMAEIAASHGIHLEACSEPRLAERAGFAKAHCIDGACLSARASTAAASDTKLKGREECGCTLHTDIGDYEERECGYSCVYCYARNALDRRIRRL